MRYWHRTVEHFLYGVPNGPYVIEEEVEGGSFRAWLMGYHLVGIFKTLEEAKAACEREADIEEKKKLTNESI